MSASLENIHVNLENKNALNLRGLNVTNVEEYNNGRVSPASDPRAPSPFQSFFQKAKEATKKVSKVFQRSSSPLIPFEEIQDTPLYQLYDLYMVNPSPQLLQRIRQEVKHLGYNAPLVKTMRSYAESAFENAYYTRVANTEKAVVNALGGSILSQGGRRKTKHQKKNSNQSYFIIY